MKVWIISSCPDGDGQHVLEVRTTEPTLEDLKERVTIELGADDPEPEWDTPDEHDGYKCLVYGKYGESWINASEHEVSDA